MNRAVKAHEDVEVGDKIVVTRYNGDLGHGEAVVTEVYAGILDVQFCGSDEEYVLYKNRTDIDDWEYLEDSQEPSNHDVKVGDKILVSKVNHEDLEALHLVTVTEVDDDYIAWIGVTPPVNGEDTLYMHEDNGDEWRILMEEYEHQHEEETLQHRQTHAYYDDEALSPSYSDAVKSGMTFADYTGVNITEASLDFEPKEEEVLRGITAESLNFEEAPKSDAVNHPSHYNYGDIEVIDVLEMLSGSYEDSTEAYLIATAAKYLFRADHKKNKVEDWEKAVWYLRRAIERGRING